MSVSDYIIEKYGVEVGQRMPIPLPISRNHLPTLFMELGYRTGAEIGVARGAYSEKLCQAGLRIYAIDAWTNPRNQKVMDGHYEEARQRLAPHDHQIIRCYSMDAVKMFKNDSLDFVYVDANHRFAPFTNDIAGWSKKVRPGGIVSGHDFRRFRNRHGAYTCHVRLVVSAWTAAYHIHPWFVTKRHPSWLWVKGEINA